jgi:glutathione peroxidase-family protein
MSEFLYFLAGLSYGFIFHVLTRISAAEADKESITKILAEMRDTINNGGTKKWNNKKPGLTKKQKN